LGGKAGSGFLKNFLEEKKSRTPLKYINDELVDKYYHLRIKLICYKHPYIIGSGL
jgi:hypothetical protein